MFAKISMDAERNAYTLYGFGLTFSDEAMSTWGDANSIDTMLEKLCSQARQISKFFRGSSGELLARPARHRPLHLPCSQGSGA